MVTISSDFDHLNHEFFSQINFNFSSNFTEMNSRLRTFFAFVKQAGLLITPENFVYILKNVFLSQPQFAKYNRFVMKIIDVIEK